MSPYVLLPPAVYQSECYLFICSKKDKSVRYQELLQVVSEPLLQYIVEHVDKLVVNNNMLLLIVAIITHAQGMPVLYCMLMVLKFA